MRQYMTVLTADNADVLDGTDLASLTTDSELHLNVASTQNDTVLNVTAPGEPTATKIRVPLRTNGQPTESDDPVIVIPTPNGGKVKVDVDIVTAATVSVTAKEMP